MSTAPLSAALVQRLSAGLQAHEAGRLEEAMAAYRQVLEVRPGQVDASHLLGVALHQSGQQGEAVSLLRAAAAARPGSPEIRNHLGCALVASGAVDAAGRVFQATLCLAPAHGEALFNLAKCRETGGDPDAACRSAARAVSVVPARAEWWLAFAVMAIAAMRLDTARSILGSLRRALPLDEPLAFHTGRLEFRSGALRTAVDWYRRAVILRPDRVESLANLAHARRVLTDSAAAIRIGRWTMALRPGDPTLEYMLADSLLAGGALDEGWSRIACRHRKPEVLVERSGLPPAWDGAPLPADQPLLVFHEQGIGDEVRFLSCLGDLLRATDGPVLVECEPRLRPLLARSFPDAEFFDKLPRTFGPPAREDYGELVARRNIARHIALGDLPVLFRRRVESFPADARFLDPPPERRAHWRTWLDDIGARPKIGICWRTGRRDPAFANEDPRIVELAPLLELDGIDIVNLQYDDCERELAAAEKTFGIRIHRPRMDQRNDLTGAVALIDELDLVVSFTTSVLVFAGAVATPAIGLCFDRDWKFLGRDHDPWFPTEHDLMRGRFADWTSVIARAAELVRARFRL